MSSPNDSKITCGMAWVSFVKAVGNYVPLSLLPDVIRLRRLCAPEERRGGADRGVQLDCGGKTGGRGEGGGVAPAGIAGGSQTGSTGRRCGAVWGRLPASPPSSPSLPACRHCGSVTAALTGAHGKIAGHPHACCSCLSASPLWQQHPPTLQTVVVMRMELPQHSYAPAADGRALGLLLIASLNASEVASLQDVERNR